MSQITAIRPGLLAQVRFIELEKRMPSNVHLHFEVKGHTFKIIVKLAPLNQVASRILIPNGN